jgi:hypothetical protein
MEADSVVEAPDPDPSLATGPAVAPRPDVVVAGRRLWDDLSRCG